MPQDPVSLVCKADVMTINTPKVLYFLGPMTLSPMGSIEINVEQNYLKNFYDGSSLKGLIAVIIIIWRARKYNVVVKVQALESESLGPNFGATIYL